MRAKWLVVVPLVLITAGVAGLVLLYTGVLASAHAGGTTAEKGEWIFRTGTNPENRQPIPHSGGMMMRMSCAGCHGVDGHGLRTMMFVSPNITYRNLTDPAGMLEPDGSRGPTYTDALIKRAVTQGSDAEGKPLAWPMPRWQLTDNEWNDLLAYLKTLP